MDIPSLLILAAGQGSRYGSLKSADPVGPNGESLVDYSIYDACRAGFGKIVFVIRVEMEQAFCELISSHLTRRIKVEFVYQEPGKLPSQFPLPAGRTRPWGTTHAVLMAAPAIREPFGVINAHDFYGADSYRALARHLSSGSTDFAVMGYVLRNTLPEIVPVARGVCAVDENGYLRHIDELKYVEREGGHARSIDPSGAETRLTGNETVSMNMWGFTPEAFGLLRSEFQHFLEQHGSDLAAECALPNSLSNLVAAAKARVKVLHCAESCFGVTYRADHAMAVHAIRQGIEGGYYPKHLWG